MNSKLFNVLGMSCNHCVIAIKKELSKLELESVEVEIGKVQVVFDESKISEIKIIETIEEAGYKVESK
ncbi:MAG: cation transporter [Melioribacteraceae bacterium]|jgi:copper chaperone CopZ|nr:cation transporter [Melioribacteraceae bacterium]